MKINKIILSGLLISLLAGTNAASATPSDAAREKESDKKITAISQELSIPEAKRTIARDAMKSLHEENKPLFQQARSLKEAQHKIMIAPTFDTSAFLALNTQITKLHETMEVNRAKTLSSIASQLTQEERTLFADFINKQRHRGLQQKQKDQRNHKTSDFDGQNTEKDHTPFN